MSLLGSTGGEHRSEADASGAFSFAAVPAGLYLLRASSTGFAHFDVTGVPVFAGQTTTVKVELQVGSVAETVEVQAEPSVLQTESAMMLFSPPQLATPRVRDYFPETLLWLPDLDTDTNGLALARFRMADSVTNWNVALFASTEDGRFAEASTEMRTFQPFFLDLQPPLVLTEGDTIELPVTVHNYLPSLQKVTLNALPNAWSVVEGSRTRIASVSGNSSAQVAWPLTARASGQQVKQRISAVAGRNRDAIEKAIQVHPNGQLVIHTQGGLIAGPLKQQFRIPPDSMQGNSRGEVVLYPNLASLLLESAGGLLGFPRGCAEQTISTGFANLVAWRFAHAAGIVDSRVEKKALANVRAAVAAISAFQDTEGGVPYWATGDADTGVTSLALQFLVEARELVPVENAEIEVLVQWLEKHQAPDGRWLTRFPNSPLADRQAMLLTGLVARSLTAARKIGSGVSGQVLAAALKQVSSFAASSDEPYLLAQYVLAGLDSSGVGSVEASVQRLRTMARPENGGLYWDLQANTPFYGWGSVGRYETTGMVVSALSAWRAGHSEASDLDGAIQGGAAFLLHGRDSLGGWHSTQATLRAMQALGDASRPSGVGKPGGSVAIRVNGVLARVVALSSGPQGTDPVSIDISAFLALGDNHFEFLPSAGTSPLLVRTKVEHLLPWTTASARTHPELRLNLQFDRNEAHPGELISAEVKAERVGFKGYGMMIAEVGLPPAADVDRASLNMVLDQRSGVDRYEILPDRVLFYLWPKAGGASFQFTFSVRMPLKGSSAPSRLYDYNNPEALAEVPPFQWSIRP